MINLFDRVYALIHGRFYGAVVVALHDDHVRLAYSEPDEVDMQFTSVSRRLVITRGKVDEIRRTIES